MRYHSSIGLAASLAVLAACSSDEGAVVTAPGTYMAPVADYDTALDTAMWDEAFYDPILIGIVIAQVTPGDAEVVEDAGVDAGADAGVVPVTRRIPRPLSALLATWGARVSSACVPSVAFVDADQDGIPLSYTANYNCVNQVSGPRTSTVTGTVIITDADDNSPTGGMSIVFTNFVVNTSISNGDSFARTLNGSISMLPQAGTFVSQRNLTIAFDFKDKNGNEAVGTHVMSEQAVYTPDPGLTDPFTSGSVNLTGQGTLSRVFQGVNESRVVTRSTNPPLHWNRSCRATDATSSGFDSGTLIYTDDQNGVFRLVFKDCGAPTASNN
jgi:hypothetical protein